ncbi:MULTISPECIES: D-ribose pyranase [Fusobacterium]|jgi:D-ribose pyranase|uniref:D-ribose pyranase n=1 Tax=Fusobacterium varium ATCC 27725 TaxID=469618 RepID=A0ABM6U615_FUSVA|nr:MULTISPECIES: D-ribose pyranase [Fusobacterium]AVQ31801.1 D-ribose pyranase [Fusobacterium varium ATCC 27725]EES63153.1 D-ribose pyranase [Fusobacterium varium ATCC 27725]MCF2672291.1 D-ribose pyranase [Fusobacterium varium]MCI6033893.1 D-ribose pyranase [Fusobacterium varium]MDY4006243.1 D-ribose pyranase [Fusobacterium varium]
MKKSRLLNSELSYEIAKIGHTAHITLCDAGLPIPQSVKRIDLAVEAGLPGFINVLDPVLSEMQVEEIILAEEIKEKNMPMYEAIMKSFKEAGMNPKVVFVPHEEFKKITHNSEAIVRTGECSPYANVILKSGVVF